MSRFLQFPGSLEEVKRALTDHPAFSGYPWIVYGETERKIHLGFNGEDVSLSLERYATGYQAGHISSGGLVRIMASLNQRRNPVPRAKGQRRKSYPTWIPGKHEQRYFDLDKVPAELPRALLTLFDKTQKRRLQEAYAELAKVFPPVAEHYELHTDTGGYDESALSSLIAKEEKLLTEEEEVNDAAWKEICRWAEEEWVGGGWVHKGNEASFFGASGAMGLKFQTYKHNSGDPRVLYSIHFGLGGSSETHFNLIFDEGTEIPATLDGFLLLYAEKHKEDYGYPSPAASLRAARKRIKTVKADPGYQSLAEVYEYVMDRLRAPVEHEELHTDTSGYEESYELGNGESMKEAASAKPSASVLRTLSLFLRFVKAFDPQFKDWANLGEVVVTADNPVWKTGGGGILKVAADVSKKFPMTVDTSSQFGLSMSTPDGYGRDITRYVDIQKNIFKELADRAKSGGFYTYGPTDIFNLNDIRDWKGPVFTVGTGKGKEATKTLRFRFREPYEVPSVESLAGVHSFKKVSDGQLRAVEVFAQVAEEMDLDDPLGRAVAVRSGAMGYADSSQEARERMPGVKAATAEHWRRQFLLGINLERKVPESAFPDYPIAELPVFFNRYRTPEHSELHGDYSYEEGTDFRLMIKSDLSLLGE